MQQKDVGPDRGAFTDDRFSADDRRTGVNGHVVLNGGMAFDPFQLLAGRKAARHEGDPLVHLHVIPDDARLADHASRTVVDKEMGTNAKYILNSGGRRIYPISNNATYYMLENYNN